MSHAIVWFRRDLRLADNAALTRALANHERVTLVYIHAPDEEAPWPMGAAQQVWLHHSLDALAAAIRALGGELILRRGGSQATLLHLVQQIQADAVYWNRLYEPALIERDRNIKAELRRAGLEVHSHNAALLHEPWNVATRDGKPYRVFTPFWKTVSPLHVPDPLPAPDSLPSPAAEIASEPLPALDLLPRVRWDTGMMSGWHAGEAGALHTLDRFLQHGIADYARGRDFPSERRVSRLSPYLRGGEISPRQVRAAVLAWATNDAQRTQAQSYIRELAWREFGYHLLYHYPHTPLQPMDARFERWPWKAADARVLRAWQTGNTGIPIVDAGMRELWATGMIHNRVRMVVASLLVKNLGMHWLEGARWFWNTLLDADLASNTLGWQWVAGCGADAAPYYRIFNPVLQGERFDGEGSYVRHYVREIAKLPTTWLHKPWQAPPHVLAEAGVRLGVNYPRPIIDLAESRDRALADYKSLTEIPPR